MTEPLSDAEVEAFWQDIGRAPLAGRGRGIAATLERCPYPLGTRQAAEWVYAEAERLGAIAAACTAADLHGGEA